MIAEMIYLTNIFFEDVNNRHKSSYLLPNSAAFVNLFPVFILVNV